MKKVTGAVVAGLLALALAGCAADTGNNNGNGSDGGTGTEPYRIGVLLGLTGAYQAVSEPQQRALELMEDVVNDSGGVNDRPVEFVYIDTESNETTAVNQLRRMALQENVLGVVGPSSSGEGLALKSVAGSLSLPTIAIASNFEISEPVEPFMFRQFPTNGDSVHAQLAYAKSQGWERVAVISSNNAYGQEGADAVAELAEAEYGLTLVGSEVFAPDATDMTAQLSTLAASDPDVLLVWAVSPANAIVAKNAVDSGFPGVVFQGTGAAATAYIELGGAAAEGTLLVGSKVLVADDLATDDPQYETVTDFAQQWRDAYGTEPNQFAGGGWDAMLMMLEALEQGDIDPSNVEQARLDLRDSLENNTNNLQGSIAIYDFNADRHGPEGAAGLAVMSVEDGAFRLIASDVTG